MSTKPMPRAGWHKTGATTQKRDQRVERDRLRQTHNGYATEPVIESNVVRIADRQVTNGRVGCALSVLTRPATAEELAAFDARTRLLRARAAGLGPGLPPTYWERKSRP